MNKLLGYLAIFILAGWSVACNTPTSQETATNDEETTDEEVEITLQGIIKNPQKGVIKLEKFLGDRYSLIDSIEVTGESFTLKTKIVEPDFYRLSVFDKKEIPLVLTPAQKNIKIEIDAGQTAIRFNVEGSKDSDYYQALNDFFSNFRKDAEQLLSKAETEEDRMKVQAVLLEKQKESIQSLKAMIDSISPSIVALVAANALDAEEEYDYLKNVAEKFTKILPNSQYTQKLSQKLKFIEEKRQEEKHLAVGAPAPDITLPGTTGKEIKLSSLKGKLVLIDFWASWCKPCRMENPNVVRIYEKYKNKGFEIYGVSLDRDRQKWIQAIQTDGLGWLHVSDLKFWESEAAQTYKIKAIPTTYLIDKEGHILAKNLRGGALEQKIKEVLN